MNDNWFNSDGSRRRGTVPPTRLRSMSVLAASLLNGDHQPPKDFKDDTGQQWLGASRVLDRPARRKAQRKSWEKLKKEAANDIQA